MLQLAAFIKLLPDLLTLILRLLEMVSETGDFLAAQTKLRKFIEDAHHAEKTKDTSRLENRFRNPNE